MAENQKIQQIDCTKVPGAYFAQTALVLVECQVAEAKRRTFCLFYADI